MNPMAQEALDMFNALGKKEQDAAFQFLKHLSELHEAERNEKNEAYLAKIRRGIKQCAEGRGISRDIIEVEDE